MCVVVILDSIGQFKAWGALSSVFFHHGNVSLQRLPRVGTYHIVNMGVICVVAV